MGGRRFVIRAACALFGVIAICGGARGDVTALHSISQITGGTRIDFEGASLHSDPNLVLAPYGITETADFLDVTSEIGQVTGNVDAPISGKAMFSFDTISTISPWKSVGLSLNTTLLGPGSYTFTFAAYDVNHALLYSDTRVTTLATSSIAELNANAFFEGLTSTTPIGSFTVTCTDGNYLGDNLTFVEAPEPGAMVMVWPAAVLLARRRKHEA